VTSGIASAHRLSSGGETAAPLPRVRLPERFPTRVFGDVSNKERAMSHVQLRTFSRLTAVVFFGLLTLPLPLAADGPGRGLTAEFEVDFLKFTIDHHFGALRVTELAAGTDTRRNAEISPKEGTSPSPEFPQTPAKALLDDLKSLARRNNRMQREEILTAQTFLQEWYGVTYEPRLTDDAAEAIERLEAAEAGKAFDIEFMEIFSRHHFTIVQAAAACLVASELRHHELRRLCRGFIENQVNDIDEMRHLLCEPYCICDYQPLEGVEGRHS
jgi:uncharacterized protein (DUF305 family)